MSWAKIKRKISDILSRLCGTIQKHCPWLYERAKQIGNKRAADLSVLLLLLMQFVLVFCRLSKFVIIGKTEELGRFRVAECFTVAECIGTPWLTVFAAFFLALALAAGLYLNFKNFFAVDVPYFDLVDRDFYLVPIVISVFYGISMLIVANSSLKKMYALTDAAVRDGVKIRFGYSFGGWLYWIAAVLLLVLVLYRIYNNYFRQPDAAGQAVEQ